MATVTLRPDGAGAETNWTPNTGANYASVDEASNDGDTTYVVTNSTSSQNDLYTIGTDAVLTGATINSVTVYYSCKYVQSGAGTQPAAPVVYALVRHSTTTTVAGSGTTTTTSYANGSTAWNTNPVTTSAWTKDDIDALQIGVRSKSEQAGRLRVAYVTQVWAVVDYTPGAIDLTIADAGHSHSADAPTLTYHAPAIDLIIADASHSHAADGLALTQHNVLAIAEAIHAHAVDGLALTQHNVLVIADAWHDHAADGIIVGGTYILVINDSSHAHAVDGLALTQHNVLVLDDSSHQHLVDVLSLIQHNILSIDGTIHAHHADRLSFEETSKHMNNKHLFTMFLIIMRHMKKR